MRAFETSFHQGPVEIMRSYWSLSKQATIVEALSPFVPVPANRNRWTLLDPFTKKR